MKPSILIVDDEKEIVKALTRLLMKHFSIHGFSDPNAALEFFKSSPTHIVLSDMKMPELTGVDLMAEVYRLSPKTRRVILTGYADAEMAQSAINDAHVHAYLGKPWDNDKLLDTLLGLITELKQENRSASAIKKLKQKNQYLQDKSEANELLNSVILSSSEQAQQQNDQLMSSHNDLINLSATLVANYTQDNFGHSTRIAQQARVLAGRISMESQLRTCLYLAGLFYRIGLTEQDFNLSAKPFEALSPQQQHVWQKLPQLSADILMATPMLTKSAHIVNNAYFVWGSEFSQVEEIDIHEKEATSIVIAAKILSLVVFMDLFMSGHVDGEIHLPAAAMKKLSGTARKYFGAELVKEYEKMLCDIQAQERFELPRTVEQLREGDRLAQDVFDKLEHCLLTQNTELNEQKIQSLKALQEENEEKLLVYIHTHKVELETS